MKAIMMYQVKPTIMALRIVVNIAPTVRLSGKAAYARRARQASACMITQMPMVMTWFFPRITRTMIAAANTMATIM